MADTAKETRDKRQETRDEGREAEDERACLRRDGASRGVQHHCARQIRKGDLVRRVVVVDAQTEAVAVGVEKQRLDIETGEQGRGGGKRRGEGERSERQVTREKKNEQKKKRERTPRDGKRSDDGGMIHAS